MTTQASHTMLQWLADSNAAQRVMLKFRLPQLANLLFGLVPVYEQLKRTGIRYRIRKAESVIVANEIFNDKVYRNSVSSTVISIMDIGCNVGFFPLFCAETLGRKNLEGIAIDANSAMVDETRWHLRKNGLSKIEAIHGLAGAPQDQQEGTFYLSPINIASSVRATPNPNLPAKGELKAIQVRTVNLAAEWKKRFGPKRIHLLKIDVEGYEKELIENSRELLALADVIAMDIHKWAVSPEEIKSLLEQNNFEQYAVAGESMHCVVGFFRRK